MKKIVSFLLICSSLNYFSQSAFVENGNHVTGGIGFPNLYKIILKTSIENQQTIYNTYGAGSTEAFSYKTNGIGPFFIKYEYGLTDHVGLGIVFGYFSAGIEESYNYQENYYNSQTGTYQVTNYTDVSTINLKSTSFGVRFNYHFGTSKKIDPYIGFATGYTHATVENAYKSNNPNGYEQSSITYTSPIPLYLGLTFGLRGYLTENIGIYGEFGLDKWAVIQGGLAFKFH